MARTQTLAAILACFTLLVGTLPVAAQDTAAPAAAPVAAPAPAAPTAAPAAAETPAPAPAATPVAASPKKPPADIVLKGDGRCTTCHDENDSPDALKIGKTRHGVTADKRAPTCSSCHGESITHEKEAGRGGKKAPAPEVAFGKKTKNTAEERNKACLSCHQGANRISWQSSAHATRDVACTSCHQIHSADDKVRNKVTQTEVCYTCHKEQRNQMSRQSHHPVPEGKMSCSSCHNVHSDNPKGLLRPSLNDTCYTCHMEKRGPFLRSHQPVTDDCSICHQPHGTTNDNLLKTRAPFLCQQCHEPTSHRATAPTFNTGATSLGSSSSQNLHARGCVNCHTNIHGTNNPANVSNERTFRR